MGWWGNSVQDSTFYLEHFQPQPIIEIMEKYDGLFQVRDGNIFGIEAELNHWLKSIPKINPDSLVKVQAKIARTTRNAEQNALYWVWCTQIADFMNERDDLGWDKDDVHRYLKSEFFVDIGEFEEITRYLIDGLITSQQYLALIMQISEDVTTTTLNEREFSEKLSRIKKHFDGLGLELKSINEPPLPTQSYD